MSKKLQKIKEEFTLWSEEDSIFGHVKLEYEDLMDISWLIEQAEKIGELEELVHKQGKFILRQSDKIEILEPQNELYREIIRSAIDEISSSLSLDSEAYEALGILEEGLEKPE